MKIYQLVSVLRVDDGLVVSTTWMCSGPVKRRKFQVPPPASGDELMSRTLGGCLVAPSAAAAVDIRRLRPSPVGEGGVWTAL